MTQYKGRDFLVKAGNGGTPTETFTAVAGMRSTSMTLNAEQVDVTTKDGTPWRKLLANAGIKSMSISLSGVFDNAASLTAMIGKFMGGTLDNYELVSGYGDKFAGKFLITSIERAGEHNGEETYTMSLESGGEITYTAGT
jgi:TP901-1 family phage major tail protein